jgi:hypothetical protein
VGQDEGLTNVGKKEQRQYNQRLDKAVKEGRYEQEGEPKEVEARTVPDSVHTGKHGSRK